MSAETGDARVKMTEDEILNFIREHHEPVVTASEIAEEFDVTNGAAIYRLNQLKKNGRVRPKEAGSSALVWYMIG